MNFIRHITIFGNMIDKFIYTREESCAFTGHRSIRPEHEKTLREVTHYGKREHDNHFTDVLAQLAEWFKRPTKMPGRMGTNHEAALYEYEACNA